MVTLIHYNGWVDIMAFVVCLATSLVSFFQGQAKATEANDDVLSILSSKVWYLTLH